MRTASTPVLSCATFREPRSLDRATYQQLIDHAHYLPMPLPLLRWLLGQGLPQSAQAVWLTYLADSWVNGVAGSRLTTGRLVSYLAVSRVAAQTGLPPETVRKANRLLVARGLLARTERRGPAGGAAPANGSRTSETEILIDPVACQGWLAAPARRTRALRIADSAPGSALASCATPGDGPEAIVEAEEPIAAPARAVTIQTPPVCDADGIGALQRATQALRARLGEERYRRLTRITSPRQAAALPEEDQRAYAEILVLGAQARSLAKPGRPAPLTGAGGPAIKPRRPATGSTAGSAPDPAADLPRPLGAHRPASAIQSLQILQALQSLKRRGPTRPEGCAISDPTGLAEEVRYALTQGVFRDKRPRHGLAICLKLIAENRWRTPYGFQKTAMTARGGEGGLALH